MASDSKFGNRLSAIRHERGLSRKELSRRSGVSEWSIANYEAGKSEPNMKSLVYLADTLGCSLDILAGKVPITSK